MARNLNVKDYEILIKLVPELEDVLSKGIKLEYQNILPPVANHHSTDPTDFKRRLNALSSADVQYLADVISNGTENTGCLDDEYVDVFLEVVEHKLSPEVALKLQQVFEYGGACGV